MRQASIKRDVGEWVQCADCPTMFVRRRRDHIYCSHLCGARIAARMFKARLRAAKAKEAAK